MSTPLPRRVCIIVAHRLSTIKNAHRVLVIDQGRVLESGSHHELLAQKGTYYNLYHTQLAKEPGQHPAMQEVGA